MQTEFSSALAKHLMATYAPDASGNAWMLARLHKAVRDPNLVTLDPALNVKREDISITPADLAVFFYYAALGIDMAHEHTILGVPLDLPKGSLRVYNDFATSRIGMGRSTHGFCCAVVSVCRNKESGEDDIKKYIKLSLSFSFVTNLLVARSLWGDHLIAGEANFPERQLALHENVVFAFLEEARHAHCHSLTDLTQATHFAFMRRNISVHKDAPPEIKKQYAVCNYETDARNLKHEIFAVGNGFSRIPEPEHVYRYFGAVMPQPKGAG